VYVRGEIMKENYNRRYLFSDKTFLVACRARARFATTESDAGGGGGWKKIVGELPSLSVLLENARASRRTPSSLPLDDNSEIRSHFELFAHASNRVDISACGRASHEKAEGRDIARKRTSRFSIGDKASTSKEIYSERSVNLFLSFSIILERVMFH